MVLPCSFIDDSWYLILLSKNILLKVPSGVTVNIYNGNTVTILDFSADFHTVDQSLSI